MNCDGCSSVVQEGFKFCPGCGKATSGDAEAQRLNQALMSVSASARQEASLARVSGPLNTNARFEPSPGSRGIDTISERLTQELALGLRGEDGA